MTVGNDYYATTTAGGFMNSPGASVTDSPSGRDRVSIQLACWFDRSRPTPSFAPQTASAHSLRPVTIKQVQLATQAHQDAEWHIGEDEVGQVSILVVLACFTS